MTRPARTRPDMTLRTLVPFVALTFALTWGIAALLILFPEPIAAVFGELSVTNPLFVLAVYAPGIVGVLLVAQRFGPAGLGGFFRRLTLTRMPLGWWAFLVLGIPALFYLGALATGNAGAPLPFASWSSALVAIATVAFIGPIEEFGWRGLMLPLLQRRLAPLWASLVVGAVWGLWHVPAFLLSGTPQSAWSFGPFFLGVLALPVLVTPMFNAARGSLLIPVLFHFQLNNPIWPDAQPWDTLAFALAAVVVVVVHRKTMLARQAGATDVVLPRGAPRAVAEVPA